MIHHDELAMLLIDVIDELGDGSLPFVPDAAVWVTFDEIRVALRGEGFTDYVLRYHLMLMVNEGLLRSRQDDKDRRVVSYTTR